MPGIIARHVYLLSQDCHGVPAKESVKFSVKKNFHTGGGVARVLFQGRKIAIIKKKSKIPYIKNNLVLRYSRIRQCSFLVF